ncbi:MAG: peptide-methionine (S)-S-oxide reductase MsrA [Bacteroidales bacterium]|nr:peptide-methionine (S)-S-oxide reductase MsrA [Bacteroidales bacterium]
MAGLVYGPLKDIWFAAGCFWGAQKFFKRIEGVDFTEVGFANGLVDNPSYEQVYTDTTGHAECVHVRYNPSVVSLEKLAELYFKVIDPLSLNKQGEDEGTRYRTGVFYADDNDVTILKEVFVNVMRELGVDSIPVELLPLSCFYRAEDFHQDYLDKNPNGYCHIKFPVE